VTDEEISPGGTEIPDPPWDPWRPEDVARLLAAVRVPWCVAAGWALDLFRGRQTREHGDLEIAVPAPDFGAVRDALAGGEPMSTEVTVRGRTIPPDELSWRFSRSPGPGGQSVNTTESRVELSYDLAASDALPPALKERALRALQGRMPGGVVTVTASEHRSQLRNREAAAARMSELLTDATAPPPKARRPTRPSRAARERRLADKQRRSEIKRLRRPTGE
jgi:ribosome-associated protein